MTRFRRFYLVWCPTGAKPPRIRHATSASALAEAKRLATAHPGQEFFVLVSEHSARIPGLVVAFADPWPTDEIPF